MALSNAEKVRRYRERQKARKQEELKKPTADSTTFRRPFFEFFSVDEQVGSQYAQALELAGIQPPIFDDDSGPEASTLDDLRDDLEEDGESNPFGQSRGTSLGRAEVLVGCLLDAASDLAAWINDYKKSEIKARLNELEASELSDVAERRAAFAQIKELNRMFDELGKTTRWPLPQWRVDPMSTSAGD